ncbi:hypothetical protein ACSZNG_07740 [Aeromonas hydrophila]
MQHLGQQGQCAWRSPQRIAADDGRQQGEQGAARQQQGEQTGFEGEPAQPG